MSTNPSKPKPSLIQPAAKQPAQLELFRLVSDEVYSNAFDFYESIPRFVVARWKTSALSRNADGTAAPIKREFTVHGKRYRLTIAPGYVDRDDGRMRAEFPGVKEELIELILIKLAMDKGYFTDSGDGSPSSDSFVLFTTLHQIHEELKRRGEVREKTKSYSYPQIREALEVLAKCKIHLKSEDDGDDLVFSPIADFGYFNDKQSKGSHPDAAKATVYIRFNALITQAILSRSWRQINYAAILGADIYLVRWFRKILGLRFSQAAPNKSYNIKLSTIIENSGITLYGRMSDNLKYVEQALTAMPDVVARYTVEKDFQVNTTSRKGRMLADAKIVVRPTHGFVIEQIKNNVHENKLEKAVVGEDGHVLLEPERSDFKSLADYDRARAAYLGSRPLTPSQSKKQLPFNS